MKDAITILWKDMVELAGGRRSWRMYGLSVLIFGLLPILEKQSSAPVGALVTLVYVAFATVMAVAQTGPDLMLREKSAYTLETLLASRLSDRAIFGGKVLTAALLGWAISLTTIAVQLVGVNLILHTTHFNALYLAHPPTLVLALVTPPLIALYLATTAIFVALWVSEQRTAYMVTLLTFVVWLVPFMTGWIQFSLTWTFAWKFEAAWVILDLLVLQVAVRLFHRERLVLTSHL